MQRQSLGSPGSKLYSHGASSALSSAKDDAIAVDDSSSSSPSKRRDSFLLSASLLPRYDEDNSSRPHCSSFASSSSPPSSAMSPRRPEKLIHLIPLLALFCCLVLYLCSHIPSQTDLAQFSGFKRPAKQIVTTDMDKIGRFIEVRRGVALAIRS